MLQQALELGAKNQDVAHPSVIEGLLSETVAHKKRVRSARSHTAMANMPFSLRNVSSTPQESKPRSMTSVSELPRNCEPKSRRTQRELFVVVDLPVEDDDEATAGGDHGLMPGR